MTKQPTTKLLVTSNLADAIRTGLHDSFKVEAQVWAVIAAIRGDLADGVTPEEAYKAIIKKIDQFINEESPLNKIQFSCSKGCSFCCHIAVEVTPLEAKIIADYCRENEIPISKKYLSSQLAIKTSGIHLSKVSACHFLSNDGTCGIYPVRPAICRKYYVTTDPKFCDSATYRNKNNKVAKYYNHEVEVFLSAWLSLFPDKDRMPKLLLPYAE